MPTYIDNVIPIDGRWAAKILSGKKTIEVRRGVPPMYSSGIYGICVNNIPDLVLGRVRVYHVSEFLSIQEISTKYSETQIPEKDLVEYLAVKSGGYCWYLTDIQAFKEPITYWSNGQTSKGAPRNNKQPEVEEQILNSAQLVLPTEEELLENFKALSKKQKKNIEERRKIKTELFKKSKAPNSILKLRRR